MNKIRLNKVPDYEILNTKSVLHIAYRHTSHNPKITAGMSGLSVFKESQGGIKDLFNRNEGGSGGDLDIDDGFVFGNLGNPDFTTCTSLTENYLTNDDHQDVNVVMWS